MNYFQKKKLAFMSIVNRVKGFIRTITGALPLTLEGCVDEESIIDYTLYGNSVQDGTPTPETPIEVESVGEKTVNLCNPDEIVTNGRKENDYIYGNNVDIWVKAGTHTLIFDIGGIGGIDLYFRKGQVSSGYMTRLRATNTKSTKYTFTFTEDEYLRISHFGNKDTVYFYNFMLVDGTKSVVYEPYGKYKIPIKVSGKNIANFSIVSDQYNVKTEKIAPNIFKVTKTNNEAVAYGQIETYVETGKTYTLFRMVESEKPIHGIHAWKGYNASSFYNSFISAYYTFTATQEKFILGLYPNQTADLKGLETTFTFMLVEGSYAASTFPDYEPYHEPITTNIYLDEPLRKVGDYADYIKSVDLNTGRGTVVRCVKEKQLKRADALYTISGITGFYTFDFLDRNCSRIKGLSNREKTFTEAWKDGTTFWLGVNTSIIYWVGILTKLGFTTLAEMNTWLKENETWIYWATETPTETPITLPPIPTFKGTSIISADTTIQPSNAEITYYSNVKE